MAITRAERQNILAQVPWIRRLKKPVQCDAYTWSRMPLKVLGNPELLEKYRCKINAYWTFTALKRTGHYTPAKSGHYCTHHLYSSGLSYNEPEQQRITKWYTKWLEKRET